MSIQFWEEFFNYENSGSLIFEIEDREETILFLVKNKIDIDMFLSGMEAIQSFPLNEEYKNKFKKSGTAPSVLSSEFEETFSWPSLYYFPFWFVVLFPDVIVWYFKILGKNYKKNEDIIKKPEIKTLFKVKKKSENLLNENKKIKISYLENLVKSYKETTKKELETSVKNLEDDTYAGEELLKEIGYKSNFTLIADITTKFYLELKRNYKDKIKDEASLLAAAGVLDAYLYIYKEKSIKIIEILEIAKKYSNLIEFIINFEIKLFEVYAPDMSLEEIKEACYQNFDEIKKTVEDIKNKYRGNYLVLAKVSHFMESPDHKLDRKLIGIIE